MEIEYDKRKSKMAVLMVAVMFVVISAVVAFLSIEQVIFSIGVGVIVVAIAYISEGAKRGRRVKIDECGIETTEWKAEWDEVEQCYIEYLGRGGDVAALVVETRDGDVKRYALHRMKYERHEIARQIDKAAGRQVFYRLKSAEASAERVAVAVFGIVVAVVAFVAMVKESVVLVVAAVVAGVVAYVVVKSVVREREMERYEREGM